MGKKIFVLTSGIILILHSLCFFTSCKKTSSPVFNNPNDSTGTTFVHPKTELYERPSDIIYTDTAIYSWRERTTTTKSFSYRLDSSDWSDFSTQKTVTFIFLDEGQHIFSVKGRHENIMSIEIKFPTDTFFVDAIRERAVYFYERTKIVSPSTVFLYQINVEQMDTFFAARLHIRFDNQKIRVNSVQRGTFFSEHSLDTIVFSGIDSIDNNNGTATLNIATTGKFTSVGSNNGILIFLSCNSISAGESFFSFDSVSFRNPQNSLFSVKQYSGRIIVK
jgi:hypothetical protein